MSKDPSPKADGLRVMREATRGHLQATAPKPKLIPYAGKDRTVQAGGGGGIPYSKTPRPDKPARKRVKRKRKIA